MTNVERLLADKRAAFAAYRDAATASLRDPSPASLAKAAALRAAYNKADKAYHAADRAAGNASPQDRLLNAIFGEVK